MKNIGYYNGKTGAIEEMTVPMNDRAVYFGDGVYDATYSKNHIPFALEDHLERFYNSCRLLRLDIKMPYEELYKLIRELVTKVDDPEQFIYWQLSRGTAIRLHKFPDAEPNLMIFCKPTKMKNVWNPVKGITVEDNRFFMCNIKTINLIPNVLAAQIAEENGCDEAIFHRGQTVTECAHSNIHIIKDGVFKTAPLNNLILPGIGRKHLLSIARENGIKVLEEAFTLDEMYAADEVFQSSSGCLGIPFNVIDNKPVGGKAPEILTLLRNEYQNKVKKYIAEHID